MSVGYVLLLCEHGFEKIIIEQLLTNAEVTKINQISGMYDMIVKLETDTVEDLRELVIWKIRKIEKIRSITTLLGYEQTKNIVT